MQKLVSTSQRRCLKLKHSSPPPNILTRLIPHYPPHLLHPLPISLMPHLRMPLHNLRSHALPILIQPPHQPIHILHLPILQRMKHLSRPLLPDPPLILRSHIPRARQKGPPRQHGRRGHGLEFEEGECGCEVRDADEDEGRVGDVKDVFV